jgi:hypothetical protein
MEDINRAFVSKSADATNKVIIVHMCVQWVVSDYNIYVTSCMRVSECISEWGGWVS